MKSDIHIRGALRVEYRVQTRPQSETASLIISEQRFAGGEGAVVALALAALGAPVRLSGNAIGTDSHGRFLLSQLQGIANLELDIEARDDVVTPYAILIRGEEEKVQTLLSPEASQLEGDNEYSALIEALRTALSDFLSDDDRVAKLVATYDANFGDFNGKL